MKKMLNMVVIIGFLGFFLGNSCVYGSQAVTKDPAKQQEATLIPAASPSPIASSASVATQTTKGSQANDDFEKFIEELVCDTQQPTDTRLTDDEIDLFIAEMDGSYASDESRQKQTVDQKKSAHTNAEQITDARKSALMTTSPSMLSVATTAPSPNDQMVDKTQKSPHQCKDVVQDELRTQNQEKKVENKDAVSSVVSCASATHSVLSAASSAAAHSATASSETKVQNEKHGGQHKKMLSGDLLVAVRNGDVEKIKEALKKDPEVANASIAEGTTLLMLAAQYKKSDVVQILLGAGADVNAKNKQNDTALMLAAEYGNSDIVQHLLNAGADVNARKDFYKSTALMIAVKENNKKVVKNLLAIKGIDVNAQDCNGDTALMVAAEYGDSEVVQHLLDAGADVNVRRDYYKKTALMIAVEKGDSDVVEKLLAIKNIDVNAQDCQGDTALMHCLKNKKIVEILLAAPGIDISICNYYQMTALNIAKNNGNTEIIQLLEDAQNKQQQEESKKTAETERERKIAEDKKEAEKRAWLAQYEKERQATRDQKTAEEKKGLSLIIAAKAGNDNEVERLLAIEGINVNAQDSKGNTALMCAAYEDFIDIVKMLARVTGININIKNGSGETALLLSARGNNCLAILINKGADVNAQGIYGNTALHYAIKENNKSNVALLIQKSASIELCNNDGNTPLLLAAKCSFSEIVEVLLKSKASCNVQNKEGMTPLMFAAVNNNQGMIELLLNHGADVLCKNTAGKTAVTLAQDTTINTLLDAAFSKQQAAQQKAQEEKAKQELAAQEKARKKSDKAQKEAVKRLEQAAQEQQRKDAQVQAKREQAERERNEREKKDRNDVSAVLNSMVDTIVGQERERQREIVEQDKEVRNVMDVLIHDVELGDAKRQEQEAASVAKIKKSKKKSLFKKWLQNAHHKQEDRKQQVTSVVQDLCNNVDALIETEWVVDQLRNSEENIKAETAQREKNEKLVEISWKASRKFHERDQKRKWEEDEMYLRQKLAQKAYDDWLKDQEELQQSQNLAEQKVAQEVIEEDELISKDQQLAKDMFALHVMRSPDFMTKLQQKGDDSWKCLLNDEKFVQFNQGRRLSLLGWWWIHNVWIHNTMTANAGALTGGLEQMVNPCVVCQNNPRHMDYKLEKWNARMILNTPEGQEQFEDEQAFIEKLLCTQERMKQNITAATHKKYKKQKDQFKSGISGATLLETIPEVLHENAPHVTGILKNPDNKL